MRLYELNGFYYLAGCNKYYDWLSDIDNKPYFMLNNVTRAKFIQDILPLIKSGECTYDIKALNNIKNFVQAPKRIPELNLKPVEPDPINKPLMQHQIETVNRMIKYPKYGFFLGTGTGKTLIAISFLLTLNLTKALIVTPKKVVDQYTEELNKYIPNNKHIVTNYEQVNKYTNQSFDVVILDESHRAKNISSQISKDLKEITSKTPNVYLFTGTPQDKQRHEIFAQFYLLYDHFMPGKTRFLNRYFTLNDYYKPKAEKSDFSNELTEMIQSISWGKETEEVIDLSACPEKEIIIKCNTPDPVYQQLIKNRIVEFPNSATVVADSPAQLKMKLREIASGFVRVQKGTRTGTKPLLNTKIPELMPLLSQLNQAIIYAEFTRNIKDIATACDNANYSYGIIDGKTKRTGEIIEQFKNNQIKFLIMQNKSGNAGLDLTCTHNTIFYTLPHSYIIFKQCKGRTRRKGQTKECNYYYLLCEDSLEYDMLKTLKRKKNYTSSRVFKIYKQGA